MLEHQNPICWNIGTLYVGTSGPYMLSRFAEKHKGKRMISVGASGPYMLEHRDLICWNIGTLYVGALGVVLWSLFLMVLFQLLVWFCYVVFHLDK